MKRETRLAKMPSSLSFLSHRFSKNYCYVFIELDFSTPRLVVQHVNLFLSLFQKLFIIIRQRTKETPTMAKLTLLLALLIFFTPSLCCPEDQKQALLEFKSSLIKTTSSPSLEIPLSELESWNSSSDCCNWERVICSTRFHPRTVIALYLDSLVSMQSMEPIVVTSTILTPLFRIRSLMLLDMAGNQI